MQTFRKPENGITLIELMIVVVIVSILAAIAYPAYQDQMRKTRRSDAKIALTEIANRQEKFYNQCNTYTTDLSSLWPTNSTSSCGSAGLGYRATSPEGYYALTVTALSTSIQYGYRATATPSATGPQATDGALTINSLGTKQYDANRNGTISSPSEDKWQ